MYSSTFGKAAVGGSELFVLFGMSACPLVVLACESLLPMCVSGAVNTQGFVWKFFMRYI